MKTIVKNGQSILDIAIQESGSAESAFDLAMKNELSPSDVLTIGQELFDVDVAKKEIVRQYSLKEIFPATAITNAQFTETLGGEGIEFWGIEYDFIVS